MLKETTLSKLKVFFILFWVLCVPLTAHAQSFEWVYSIFKTEDADPTGSSSFIKDMVTNSNNEIYAIGSTRGHNDFDDGQGQLVINGNWSFVAKLDENKNVLWVKTLSGISMKSIALDTDGNIVVCGIVRNGSTAISLDPAYASYDPDNPHVHEDLSEELYHGFVIKLDPNGNYIDSLLFENIIMGDLAVDSNNNLVAVGSTDRPRDDYGYGYRLSAYVCKLDEDLNLLWEKTYGDDQGVDHNIFLSVAVDSQNNIYCQGTYNYDFTFGNYTLQNSSASEFVCKLLPNGNEDWIIELYGNLFANDLGAILLHRKIEVDANDDVYFFTSYQQQYSYQFANTSVNSLPLTDGEEAVVFKVDVSGNHLWNLPLHGTNDQEIGGFTVNGLGELIVFIVVDGYNLLQYTNMAGVETNSASSLLLKAGPTGQLRNFTRMDIEDLASLSDAMASDDDNNIYIQGFFERTTDFDPHPFTEHFLSPDGSYNPFLLKLSNCESEPYYEDTYVFCAATDPNPTLTDIVPSPLNIEWFASMSSQTPLDEGELLTDGETYYYETLVEGCPSIGRHPVQVFISPPPDPPIVNMEQPCYTPEMTLSDLNIDGENLAFYASQQAENPLEPSTGVVPGTTYYVSQTTACESERVPVVVTDYFGEGLSEYTAYFCTEEEGTTEYIDLSDYKHYFIPANAEEADYVFSYHHSLGDADENSSPIIDFQNYPVSAQTIYVRVYSIEAGCYKIAQLSLQFSIPPVIEDIEINDWTSNKNSITVFPNGENYTYSLNGTTYQSSNHFDNLPPGEYTVYIKNGAGCDGRPKTIFLLNYPKFFTPNKDGQNDYWNIDFSQLQEVFNVEIYDRYGKLITSFGKDHMGWDGNYNGKRLPSSEFWFRIRRVSNQEIIYTGHFSLIR